MTEPPRNPDTAADAPGGLRLLDVRQASDLFAAPEETVRELVRTRRLPTRDRYVVVPEVTRLYAAAKLKWAQAHGLGAWVVLDEAIRAAQKECGVEPDVIRFLLAWNGVFYTGEQPFLSTKLSEAYRKRIKRRVAKGEPPSSRTWMLRTISDVWKQLRRLRQLKTLFKLVPIPPNSPHRAPDPRWGCCFDLRNYFRRVTGQPQMKYVARILFPDWELASVEQRWSRNKHWFRSVDGGVGLERALRFYFFEPNNEKIRRAIKTGIPMYELPKSKPHPGATPPKVWKGMPLKWTLRRGICANCRRETEWMTGTFAPCECGAFVSLTESNEFNEPALGNGT